MEFFSEKLNLMGYFKTSHFRSSETRHVDNSGVAELSIAFKIDIEGSRCRRGQLSQTYCSVLSLASRTILPARQD